MSHEAIRARAPEIEMTTRRCGPFRQWLTLPVLLIVGLLLASAPASADATTPGCVYQNCWVCQKILLGLGGSVCAPVDSQHGFLCCQYFTVMLTASSCSTFDQPCFGIVVRDV